MRDAACGLLNGENATKVARLYSDGRAYVRGSDQVVENFRKEPAIHSMARQCFLLCNMCIVLIVSSAVAIKHLFLDAMLS